VSRWIDVAVGISLAGGVYAILLAWAQAATTSRSLSDALFFSIPAGFFGVLWAGVIALFIMPLFNLFVRSVQVQASLIWLGAILGRLVGFLACVALVPVTFGNVSFGYPWDMLFMIAFGPCRATVVGQAGGAWGGWLEERPGDGTAIESVPARKPLFQFRLRQLLWLTVWLDLFLAAIAATGMPEVLLAVFGTWLVFQAATLYLGSKLLRLIGRWRVARRQRRSA
jgi:hypothetical protein